MNRQVPSDKTKVFMDSKEQQGSPSEKVVAHSSESESTTGGPLIEGSKDRESTTTAAVAEAEERKPSPLVEPSKPQALPLDASTRESSISPTTSGFSSAYPDDDETVLIGQTYRTLMDKNKPNNEQQHNTGLTFPQKVRQ